MQIGRTLLAMTMACGCAAACANAQGLCGAAGADIVLSHIEAVQNGPAAEGADWFMLGTRQTNVGSVGLQANILTQQHPIQTQNLYRHTMVGGISRFEQIGMSWVFHAGIPLNMGGFCTCQGGSTNSIGPGCSDPHSAGAIATAQSLGPRWEVDAASGYAVHPHSTPAGPWLGRLRFDLADLEPGANYFGEVLVLHPDEDAVSATNNAAWRPLLVSEQAGNAVVTLTGATAPGAAAIEAWKTLVSGVSEAALDVPGDGRYIIAARVVRIGGNQWNYEYAVFNLNSHRSARAFGLPRPAGVVVSMNGFHDVGYHSGDGPDGVDLSGVDWNWVETGDALRWETATESADPAANALRWGTLYNFRVACNMMPVGGEPLIEFYREGEPGSLSAALPVPGLVSCLGDHNGDGARTVPDIFAFLSDWFAHNAAGDCDGDGTNTVPDIFHFLASWFSGC